MDGVKAISLGKCFWKNCPHFFLYRVERGFLFALEGSASSLLEILHRLKLLTCDLPHPDACPPTKNREKEYK